MKKTNSTKLTAAMAIFALTLTGCANFSTAPTAANTESVNNVESINNTKSINTNTESAPPNSPPGQQSAMPVAGNTIQITDSHGTVTVPVNPERVVALDNRTFETLSDWGIELAAAPKGVMPADSPYAGDDAVQDIGSHNDPNLEIIAAVNPELVIVGQRFASFYDDIKELVPHAAVIDLSFDVSAESAAPGDNLVNGLTSSTRTLGRIFEKNAEAEALVSEFEQAIKDTKAAYNGTDRIISVVVSGGEIGFSAPGYGRVWGPMYDVFGWNPALEADRSSSDHMGDDISVEAIAQSNPDWIFVLDRDAAVSSADDAVPAQDVINRSPALKNTAAVTRGHIVYAPNDTYANESIQTYLELFEALSGALGGQ